MERATRRPAAGRRRDSRQDVFRAAQREFAAHGFDGAGVDRIARRARVNKAMIYYHFGSKLGLYREILRDAFIAVAARGRAAVEHAPDPAAALDAYMRALLAVTDERPYLVPMLLREIAGGGRRLDADSLALMVGVFNVVRDVLLEGQRRGQFDSLDPLLLHFLITGATLLYVANEPIRTRVRQLRLPDGPRAVPVGAEPFLAHMAIVLRRALRPQAAEAHA